MASARAGEREEQRVDCVLVSRMTRASHSGLPVTAEALTEWPAEMPTSVHWLPTRGQTFPWDFGKI